MSQVIQDVVFRADVGRANPRKRDSTLRHAEQQKVSDLKASARLGRSAIRRPNRPSKGGTLLDMGEPGTTQ